MHLVMKAEDMDREGAEFISIMPPLGHTIPQLQCLPYHFIIELLG